MNKQIYKTKWHYLIIASILMGLIASIFVVGASAEESVEPFDFAFTDYYPCEPTGTGFNIVTPVYLLPKDSGDDPITGTRIFQDGSSVYVEVPVIGGGSKVIAFNSSKYFLLLKFADTNVGNNFAPLNDVSEFFSVYTRSVKSSIPYRIVNDDSPYSYGVSWSCKIATLSSSGVFTDVYSSSSITVQGNYIFLDNDRTIDMTGKVYYVRFDESHSLSLAEDGNTFCLFYEKFIPYDFAILDPTSPPSGDVDLTDFTFVIDFIVDIFNGMDNLKILPNVSILDICLAFMSIFILRFILKLVAGG